MDIPLFRVAMNDDVSMVSDVLRSGYIGQGPMVEQFEGKLKKHFNTDHLVTVNSATSAEHLAMHMIKKTAGDRRKVLTTPLTCTASNWPILANGYDIEWVDVDPNTFNIDLDNLATKLTPDVAFVMVVHWGGYPVDLDKLDKILEDFSKDWGYKPPVIEDGAHAWCSRYKNKYIGTHGNYNTFSFQAIKHLTTGDGGALVLPNQELAQRARLLRWYGIDRENNSKDFRCEADVAEWGFKFHMNDINAAIGINNWGFGKHAAEVSGKNGRYYNMALRKIDGIELLEKKEGYESSYWIYSMKVERQPDFMRAMSDRGISTSRVHERNDRHTAVKAYRRNLPQLDSFIDSMICIPSGWWVRDEERQYIIDSIKQGW